MINKEGSVKTMQHNQPTHQLPQHLGAWPCRIIAAASDLTANNLRYGTVLAEYTTPEGTYPIVVVSEHLTPIAAPDPGTPWLLDRQDDMWIHSGTHTDGQRSFHIVGTSPESARGMPYSDLHARYGPLRGVDYAEAWLDRAPALPFSAITAYDPVTMSVTRSSDSGSSAFPIRASVEAYLDADEAEQFAYALLRAVRDTRAKDAGRWVAGRPVTVGDLTDGGVAPAGGPKLFTCKQCPTLALCVVDDKCHNPEAK